MLKDKTPQLLAELLVERSVCNVKVAAVIVDEDGVVSWGWNNTGPTGYGEHAEVMALRRANPSRRRGATIYTTAKWNASGNLATARPCADCLKRIRGAKLHMMVYQTKAGDWEEEFV